MQDISNALTEVMKKKKCSSLLAFIVVSDGIYLQQSKSSKESSGRLRNKRNIHTDR